jgi:hypothetical protein
MSQGFHALGMQVKQRRSQPRRLFIDLPAILRVGWFLGQFAQSLRPGTGLFRAQGWQA